MSLISRVISRGTSLADGARPVALLLIRLVVGGVFLFSGWGKLHGLEGVTNYFRELGIPYPELQAPFVAGVEFVGGLLVLVGLGTRLIVAPLSVTMVVAIITAKWADVEGLADFAGLSEVDYLVMFFALFTFGAGALSLDAVLARVFKGSKPAEASAPPAAVATAR